MSKKAFDISKASVSETTTVDLSGPDGEELHNDEGQRLSITVYGPGSKVFQKAQNEKNRAILEQVRKGKKKMSSYAQRELDAEFLSEITVSFNGFAYRPDEYEPGPDMYKAAYLDYSIGYIADQVNSEAGDWANFTKA